MPARTKPKARKRTRKPLRRVRVRTYRHGLGDCHLVSFTKPDGKLFHLLIDCGVVDRTPDPRPLMTAVAKNIAQETGGELDVVVATHQHTDHLSGFKQAAAEFGPRAGGAARGMNMKRLWLAWTEDKSTGRGRKVQKQILNKLAAVRAAAAKLAPTDRATADRIKGVLDFFGPVSVAGEETQEILDTLHQWAQSPPEYHEPGDVFTLPEVPNVRVYVLGPPHDPDALTRMNPRKTKKEGYEELTLAAHADGFASALLPDGDPELSFPFAARFRQPTAWAKAQPFFQQHYFDLDPETKEPQDWRQIDTAWLTAAEQLALYLNTYTNNTSLALVFELIDTGEVLLFPGDAQIGSWLTWHELEWKMTDGNGQPKTVRAKDLFARTVFYKASHHASHNGTLSGLGEKQTGLEHMNHRELVCVVPVDRAMSKKMKWDRTLPWEPLLKRLREQTRGRLIFTDATEAAPAPNTLGELSPAEQRRFAARVAVTNQWIDFTL